MNADSPGVPRDVEALARALRFGHAWTGVPQPEEWPDV